MLIDEFDRRVNYLRLSLTDRCNLRCVYCMPEEGLSWIPTDGVMQDDEIITLLRDVYAPLGVTRIRLTGGEPLLRKNLVGLVARMAIIPGIEDIALTTNGMFLAPLAADLAHAGLRRVNVSLDSLQAERFKAITRGGDLGRVLKGIDAALAAGLDPVKINMVVIRGNNEDEVRDFAALTLDRPVHVRFIEMMHVGDEAFFQERQYVPVRQMLDDLERHFRLEAPAYQPVGNGPAKYRKIRGAQGTIGFITPMSVNFCHTCNRTRLTADGQIKACLMRPQEQDLLGALRRGETVERLQEMVLQSLQFKPQHHEWGAGLPIERTMSRIGG